MNFLIGKLISNNYKNTSYGPCANLYISIFYAKDPNLKGHVKVTGWKRVAELTKDLRVKQFIMVEFTHHRKQIINGKEYQVITAKNITESSSRELRVYLTDI